MQTITSNYPTAEQIYTSIREYMSLHGIGPFDWDDFVYDFISNYDEQFRNDPEWFIEDDHDMKDLLREEVLELLGIE